MERIFKPRTKKHFIRNSKENYIEIMGGFTVIEMLVVIAIISVLMAVVISNFPQIRLQLSLSRVAYKFDQDLRKAQNLASGQVAYKDSSGNVLPVDGYGIYVNIAKLGNQKYLIYADKPSGSVTKNGIDYPTSNEIYDSSDYLVDTIDFGATDPGVVIKEIDAPSYSNDISFDFNSSDLATVIYSDQLSQNESKVDVVFALKSNLTKTKTVSINQSGSITIK